MIVNWTDVNDDKSINIEINIPNLEYLDWVKTNSYLTDKDIIVVL